MKVIDAVCVTSVEKKRTQISFDEKTGLILDVGNITARPDHVFGDECLLFAGMGDIHIHAREDVSGKNNYKEDFLSAQKAMQNGGVSHAGDMPNNPIPPVDDESYKKKFELALKAHGDLWLYAGIGPETKPLSYSVPYKVYMGPSVGELYFKDLETLDKTLQHYRGEVVSFHCEDPEILKGHEHESTHEKRRPVEAEVVATKDALMLIEKHQLKGKLCHYSAGEGLKLIRDARARGVNVSIEVTPQHLYFNVANLRPHKFFQMNPPIRSEHDRQALWEALVKGEIDYLATDHAPHTMEEKIKGTSGLTGLDTYGPFVTWLIDQGIDPGLVAKITAEKPGDFFNQFLPEWKKRFSPYARFGEGVGYLKKGFRASFTVLNLKRPTRVEASTLKTKVGHSPFLDITFPGSVEALFIGGQKV